MLQRIIDFVSNAILYTQIREVVDITGENMFNSCKTFCLGRTRIFSDSNIRLCKRIQVQQYQIKTLLYANMKQKQTRHFYFLKRVFTIVKYIHLLQFFFYKFTISNRFQIFASVQVIIFRICILKMSFPNKSTVLYKFVIERLAVFLTRFQKYILLRNLPLIDAGKIIVQRISLS